MLNHIRDCDILRADNNEALCGTNLRRIKAPEGRSWVIQFANIWDLLYGSRNVHNVTNTLIDSLNYFLTYHHHHWGDGCSSENFQLNSRRYTPYSRLFSQLLMQGEEKIQDNRPSSDIAVYKPKFKTQRFLTVLWYVLYFILSTNWRRPWNPA